jgi:hypothetical protein
MNDACGAAGNSAHRIGIISAPQKIGADFCHSSIAAAQ